MFKKPRLAFIVALLAVLAMIATACGNTDAGSSASSSSSNSNANSLTTNGNIICVKGNLQITGSTALQPLVSSVAIDYQKKCSGSNITVGGGGSTTGLRNVHDGSSQIGMSDVFADKATYPELVDHQVAVVSFAIVINNQVTNIDNLTSKQMQGIYSGKTKNWNELGGPNLPIVAVSRPAGSGTRLTFEEYVLHGKETISGNPVANSSGEVGTTVSQTNGAISYIASDFARKNNLKVIKLDGVAESNANVQNNTYKFWNIEHMFTRGQPTGLTGAFINYMKSPDVEPFRQQQGFIDVSKMSQSAIEAKTPANSK